MIGAALLGLGCLCNAAGPMFTPRLIGTILSAGDFGLGAVRLLSPVLQVGFCGPLVLGLVFLLVGIVMMIAGRQPKAVPEPAPSAAVASAAKTCPACGAENPPDNVFCEHCGTPLA